MKILISLAFNPYPEYLTGGPEFDGNVWRPALEPGELEVNDVFVTEEDVEPDEVKRKFGRVRSPDGYLEVVPDKRKKRKILSSQPYQVETQIGPTAFKALIKHPWYVHHITSAGVDNPEMQVSKRPGGFTSVSVTNQGKLMLIFDLVAKRITAAHIFKWDGKTLKEGRPLWQYSRSYEED